MVLYNIYTIYKKGQTWTWNTRRKNRLLVKSFNILGESDWGKHYKIEEQSTVTTTASHIWPPFHSSGGI